MLRACAGNDPVKELCEINPTIIMFLLRFWLRGEHPEISFRRDSIVRSQPSSLRKRRD